MSSLRTRIKMCGMTRKEDLEYAIHLGVDALGLIFYEKSSRYISLEQAKILIKNLPPFVDAVGVLVNPEKNFVHQLLEELPLNVLQFHGDESPEFCQQFSVPYIKTIHPKNSEEIISAVKKFNDANAILLDSSSPTDKGGTGLSFDWEIIPLELDKPYILAGGINEFNIIEAIKLCHPYAIDVCSGIEAVPGVKDHLKMERLIKVVRSVE